MAGRRLEYLGTAATFTVAGCLSSALLGLLAGTLGSLVRPAAVLLAAAAGFACLGAVREFGLIRFRVPAPDRQTCRAWAVRRPAPRAALLWGLDLGLTFSTRTRLIGPPVLIVAAVAAGTVPLAAGLLVAHWLGRACSVWIAPRLLVGPSGITRLMASIDTMEGHFRTLHGVGLVCLAAVLAVLAVGGGWGGPG